jgi:hypothetical protein
MTDQKVTTIRQSTEQAAELEAVARVDGIPVAEVIRTAIAEHIQARRNDPAFRDRLQRRLEEDQVILEKLAKQ